jgi:hypothetical protein
MNSSTREEQRVEEGGGEKCRNDLQSHLEAISKRNFHIYESFKFFCFFLIKLTFEKMNTVCAKESDEGREQDCEGNGICIARFVIVNCG